MTQSVNPWMEHAETGHRAQLPDDPYWRGVGWNPCDGPPPEVDTLHDPDLHDQAPEPEPEPEPAAKPTKSAAKPAKSEES